MKTQAWGWLAVAVLAAGLNSSYHNGGMQWAHEIADRVEHNTGAVLALATGRADRFLAEARILNDNRRIDTEMRHCPLATAMADVETSFDQPQSEIDRIEVLSAREQAKLDRLEANRARIEAQMQAKLARVQFADSHFSFTSDKFTPVVVQLHRIQCPRVHVTTHIPRVHVRVPRIEVPAQVVELDKVGQGPI